MVFSSPVFLFFFLPVVLLVYFLLPKRLRNLFLLLASIIFYSWGEGKLIVVMATTIVVDYLAGLTIANNGLRRIFSKPKILTENEKRTRLQIVTLAISLLTNIGLLAFFKYANFGIDTARQMLESFGIAASSSLPILSITLPLGISFYTFQSMSYTIDVYRGHTTATRNFINFACFVTLFPQLIAGPIVRYADIAKQMVERVITRDLFASGIQRFIIGLGKKVLVANVVSVPADLIFSKSPDILSSPVAWFGVVCYALQIYFDFSGYSDMAIGLGRMFGFRFLENFNYPYIATSIQDFWRRWHMSLSTWFRDYLYISIGGNRKGRTYLNLLIVFFLTGLWHGASWSFVVWGLFHGAFLVFERLGFSNILEKTWRPIKHLYVLLVVLVGWVLFRAETLSYAVDYLQRMFSFSDMSGLATYLNAKILIALFVGVVFAAPITQIFRRIFERAGARQASSFSVQAYAVASVIILAALFILSSMQLASGTYNPFIYFRF